MTDSDSDVIDRRAHARLEEWGGAKLLTQMIRLFLDNAPSRLDQVRHGLAEGNVGDVERGAHSLKSSAANVGAMTVSRIAADMENHASAGNAAAVAELFPGLDGAFAKAREQLAATIEDSAEPEA